MRAKSKGKINATLEKALEAELKEVTRRHDADSSEMVDDMTVTRKKGDFVYTLDERMKVYDRALKMQAIRLKSDDPDFGSAFDKGD